MKVRKSVLAFGMASALLFSGAAMAGPAADNLGVCMAQSIDHHDRVVMDRFFFAALSEHPDLQGYVKLSGAARNKISKDMRALMVRLIRHDCHHSAARAAHAEGPAAARHAVLALMGDRVNDLAHSSPVLRELNGLTHGEVADAIADAGHDVPPPPDFGPGPHGPDAPPPPPFR